MVRRIYQFLILFFLLIGNLSCKLRDYNQDIGSALVVFYVICLFIECAFSKGSEKQLKACQDLRESSIDSEKAGQWIKKLSIGLYLKCTFLLLFYVIVTKVHFSFSIRGLHDNYADKLILSYGIFLFMDCSMASRIIKNLKIYQKNKAQNRKPSDL